jgi:hypothetical protein
MLVAMVAAGCDEGVQHPDALGDVLREQENRVQRAVVTIDDRKIDAAQFQAFWVREPELSRAEAVEAFVRQEALFPRALERGFADRPAVAVARKRAMVRHLLERTVEREVTEDTLDANEIEKMARQVEAGVGHPVGLRASHILVSVAREKDGEKKENSDGREAAYERARMVLGDIEEALPDNPTPFELVEAKREFAEKVDKPLSVVVNAHLRFPSEQTEKSTLPDGWLNVVPEFRGPAVELAMGGRFGALSEPVRSPFGWHLIVVHETIPGAEPDPQVVREVAIARLLEQKRSEAVVERFKAWSRSSQTRTFPNVIEEAEDLE